MNESENSPVLAKWKKIPFLPIYFECPICQQEIKKCNQEGTRVGCACIVVDYDGRRLAGLDNIIPGPSELIPKWISGESVDFPSIQKETSFRWGQLVRRQLAGGHQALK